MKILGIDYGSKRVGIAVSDEGGTLAFPKEIILNDKNLLTKLNNIVEEENVEEIVVGESVDFRGVANPIGEDIKEFIQDLTLNFMLPVHTEKEFLTTVEARRYGEGKQVDSSAAALILQRYLDRKGRKS